MAYSYDRRGSTSVPDDFFDGILNNDSSLEDLAKKVLDMTKNLAEAASGQ